MRWLISALRYRRGLDLSFPLGLALFVLFNIINLDLSLACLSLKLAPLLQGLLTIATTTANTIAILFTITDELGEPSPAPISLHLGSSPTLGQDDGARCVLHLGLAHMSYCIRRRRHEASFLLLSVVLFFC